MIPLLTSMVSRLRTGLLLSCCWFPMFVHAQAATWADGFSVEVKPNDRLTLMYSPYTYHFSKSDEHKYVWLVGVEREREDGRLSGITYFSNSFGQPSTYIFPWGQIYRNIGGIPGLFAKWSGGLLYGYVEPYENKVPLNVNGFSPAIIPSIGYEKQGYGAQLNWLGTAGLMLQFNIPLGR
ncbi:MAG: hypothetical protein RJA56_597 [Pseudomonadota bacterium]